MHGIKKYVMNYVLFFTFDRDDREPPKLTESGFQFLVWADKLLRSFLIEVCINYCLWQLMDTNAQLWYIIREYITNAEVSLLLASVAPFPLLSIILKSFFGVKETEKMKRMVPPGWAWKWKVTKTIAFGHTFSLCSTCRSSQPCFHIHLFSWKWIFLLPWGLWVGG